jgi:hypothetical protein
MSDDRDSDGRVDDLREWAASLDVDDRLKGWWSILRQRAEESDADERAANAGAHAWARTKQFFGTRNVQLAIGALATVAAGIIMTVIAATIYGFLSGIATAIGLIAGVSGPWIYVRVARTPALGGVLSTAFFVLAQLTFGAGAIIRREDGRYEWRRLHDGDEDGLYATLSNGRRVDIDGEINELPTLAWAPVAVVEEHSETALSHILVDEQEWADERPNPRRGSDGTILTPLPSSDGAATDGGGYRIDSAKLARWCQGSAEAEPVRSGLQKALEEEGGAQQLSQLYLMIGAGVLMIFGFGMTAAVMLV